MTNYSTNPLVDQLKARNPLVHGLASKEAPAPTMWHTGDLPLLLASGADPSVLSSLPPGTRHAAAALPTPAALMAFVDQYAGAPEGTIIRTPEWDSYLSRTSEWGSGLHGGPVVTPSAEAAEALAVAMFGAGNVLPEVPVDRVAEARKRDAEAARARIQASDDDWHRYQESGLAKP